MEWRIRLIVAQSEKTLPPVHLVLKFYYDFALYSPLFTSSRHCSLSPTVSWLFTDTSARHYACWYSTVSLCQNKLKNTTFLTLQVFRQQNQFVLNKYGTIKAMQLFYGTYFICYVVFQLKLAATSKRRHPKANPINKRSC